MKKYLMIGFAAVAFASCSNHDFETYSPEQIVKAEYDAKFIAEFGNPGPNQNWGFGPGTRAFTRGFYADANEWAATDGGQYIVPDPLTPGQKARVQYYFQMNQYPGGTKDYGQIDFFVQQVYTGSASTAMAGKSPEIYKSVARVADNGDPDLAGGTNMDHLTAGSDAEHINNFNHGTRSTYPNVLDYTDEIQYAKNDNDQHHHPDEISLMLKTKTDKFGYANSDASIVRNDRYRQVSAEDIDNFCDNDANFATWLSNKGITDDKVNDKWAKRGRSFIGFDFDMITDWKIYTGTEVWTQKEGGQPWETELTGKTYSDYDYYRYDLYGAKYHYLITNDNMYCGTPHHQDPEPTEAEAKALLDQGYLPIAGKANKDWVKVGGCADGYYSDWIVSFMPAKKYSTINYDGRIMAEDLSVNQASDWDFNDVVFDYKLESDGTCHILLQAAGGTLPLKIGRALSSDGEVLGGVEVHDAFGLTNTSTMINTGAGPRLDAVSFDLPDKVYSSNEDIKLFVQKKVDGIVKWVEITAVKEEPAGKFVTDTDTDWCDEYVNIKYAYTNFKSWVNNGSGRFPAKVNGVSTAADARYFDRTVKNEPAPLAD